MLFIDYETKSGADLPKQGQYKYAEDLDHKDILVALAGPTGEARTFDTYYDLGLPAVLLRWIQDGKKLAGFGDFDRVVTNAALKRMHLQPLAPGQYVDIQVMCLELGLPAFLLGAGKALKCKQDKLDTGKALIKLFCMPQHNTKAQIRKGASPDPFWATPEDHPEEWDEFIRYADGDVLLAREIYDKIKAMTWTPEEQAIYEMNCTINDRGIAIDLDGAHILNRMRDVLLTQLNHQVTEVSGGEITTIGQVSRITEYCGTNSAGKEALTNALPNMDPKQQLIAKARLEGGRTSLGKLPRFLICTMQDQRARGTLQFCGTHTKRWAGRLMQPHNLPRDCYSASETAACIEVARHDLANRSAGAHFTECYPNPVEALTKCLRGLIIPSPGNELIVADYSAIEARLTFWYASQQDAVEIYRTGGDIYKEMASTLFHCPVDQVTKDQRFVGKVLILGSIYGLGYKGLHADLMTKGVLDDEEEDTAREYTNGFRERFFALPQYWHNITTAFDRAFKGQPQRFPSKGLTFARSGGSVYIEIATGSRLWYHGVFEAWEYPPWELEKEDPKERKKHRVLKVRDKGMNAPYVLTRSILAENISSMTARDIMARGMLRLEAAGYPLVLSVHDEIVADVPIGFGELDEVDALLCEPLEWAPDLPLATESERMDRYGK